LRGRAQPRPLRFDTLRKILRHPHSSCRDIVLAAALLLFGGLASAQPARFQQLCASCHGEGAAGGDRAPGLVENRALRTRTEAQIKNLIRNGTPGGMPAFPLPDEQLDELAHWVHSLNASAYETRPPGDIAAGRQFFFGAGQCSSCHMVRGQGRVNGPDLSLVGRELTVREIEGTLTDPSAQMGTRSSSDCPSWAFCPQNPWTVVNVELRNGSTIRGFARSQGQHDLQLQTFDGQFRLLTDTEYKQVSRESKSYMPPLHASEEERRNLGAYLSSLGEIPLGPISLPAGAGETADPPKPGEWATYNGALNGNRYSTLQQINRDNVGQLQSQWVYSFAASGLETTPLVKDGVMFVTGPDQVCALDARVGRRIWCYTHERGNAEKTSPGTYRQPNRGVALLGDSVFFTSGDAHLLSLNRLTGGVMWDVKLPETAGRYEATLAPLVVDGLVVCGVAGGDTPLRGFIAAYRAETGEQAWRFWTVPKKGEPGSETWDGTAIETGGGATWLTGSYDAETDTLYWATGNPFPATDGGQRGGVNLYTNCVLALDPKTGKLRWYFQFTPHDLHDWDATEPLVLVDASFHGRVRKLLLQANRSGFFYVLDRTNGEFLLGKPFVRDLNWASGIGPDGKPQLLAANETTTGGVKTCPAVRGATNWYSTSYSPEMRLFYVMAVEDCSVYRISRMGGYEGYRDPQHPGRKYLKAINIESGNVVWDIPQVGVPEDNYSGVLSTAGGLVFYGESGGGFAAIDAKTSRCLWHYDTGAQWKASPMTYLLDGRQYVAIAAGGNIISFALPDDAHRESK
jgi:PQQ-dependent dehydrogenase (methanol/ethanol family)